MKIKQHRGSVRCGKRIPEGQAAAATTTTVRSPTIEVGLERGPMFSSFGTCDAVSSSFHGPTFWHSPRFKESKIWYRLKKLSFHWLKRQNSHRSWKWPVSLNLSSLYDKTSQGLTCKWLSKPVESLSFVYQFLYGVWLSLLDKIRSTENQRWCFFRLCLSWWWWWAKNAVVVVLRALGPPNWFYSYKSWMRHLKATIYPVRISLWYFCTVQLSYF